MDINIPYLDFIQESGLVSLVNENHVDKYLKEILAFIYYGLIVNMVMALLYVTLLPGSVKI